MRLPLPFRRSPCLRHAPPARPRGPRARCERIGEWVIPRRIAFINEKGGSAKTTLAANVGAWLALHGQRVLAVDLDPQGQLGKVLGVAVRSSSRSTLDLLLGGAPGDDAALDRPAPTEGGTRAQGLPRIATRIRHLDLVPANKSLALYPGFASGEEDPTARLARTLDAAPECADYDWVLLDAPPSFGPLTLNVLRAASEVVIPVPLTFLALDGCAELLRTLHTVRTRYGNPGLRIAMVVPTFYRRTRMAHEVLDRLKARFPKELSQTVLGFHVKIDEAQSHGLSIFEYAPRDRGARALAALAEELMVRQPAPEGGVA